MRESRINIEMSDGAVLSVRCCCAANRPRILIGHGNGFSVNAFAQLVDSVATWGSVLAIDLRNHGLSSRYKLEAHTQARLRLDMIEVMDYFDRVFGPVPTYGLFHSLSGLHALYAELNKPNRFRRLVLIEPPVSPPPTHNLHNRQIAAQISLVEATQRRRDRFSSIEEMVDRLRDRPRFQYLSLQALQNYCGGVLRKQGENWILQCSKKVESAGYENNLDDGFFSLLPSIAIPVLLLSSDSDSLVQDLTNDLVQHAGFDSHQVSDSTHLMPMEIPETVSTISREYFGKDVEFCSKAT